MIAMICHEANRAYCAGLEDNSQLPWDEAPQWQRDSAINGVLFHLNNPDAEPSHSHENWMEEKRLDGWMWGEVKDPEKKLHPCYTPYANLPEDQKAKDKLFISVVDTFRSQHPPEVYSSVKESKRLRKALDGQLQVLKESPRQGRERSLAITKIQEGIMWLGMDLGAQKKEGLSDESTPYPDSYDASNEKIAPTAGGLKL